MRKNGGILFNKIPGGHNLQNGILKQKFKYNIEKTKSLEPIIIEYFRTGKQLENFIY